MLALKIICIVIGCVVTLVGIWALASGAAPIFLILGLILIVWPAVTLARSTGRGAR